MIMSEGSALAKWLAKSGRKAAQIGDAIGEAGTRAAGWAVEHPKTAAGVAAGGLAAHELTKEEDDDLGHHVKRFMAKLGC